MKKILIANPGSTSLKFKLMSFPSEEILASGKIERIGSLKSAVFIRIGDAELVESPPGVLDYRAGIGLLLEILKRNLPHSPNFAPPLKELSELSAIGFKAVHGGKYNRHTGATLLTAEVVKEMERMLPTAPVHNKAYLQVIRSFEEVAPEVPRVALFEPAFHATISEEKITYGIPLELKEKFGIRRYGFHGASHHYIADRVPQLLNWSFEEKRDKRILSCHLGGSSSLCAIRNGQSIDTTMGFSPQSGIIQSTRCESIDPFAVLFMETSLGLTPQEVGKVLCNESGLKGVSRLSEDMRDLWEAAENGNQRAELSLDVFFYQVKREIAAMTASLGGLDILVFTGGIGENGYRERELICEDMEYLGIQLDNKKNEETICKEGKISTPSAKVETWVIPTNEELVVGREVYKLLTET